MSVLEELIREIERSPERARKLLEKMAEVYPELSLSVQMLKINERIVLLLEEQKKIWEEIKGIKEEQARTWKAIEELREEQVRLREDFNRETTRLWEEIKGLREEQKKIWEEIKGIKEEQARTWKAIEELRKEQMKVWQEIRDLRIQQGRLERKMDGIYEGLSASIMYTFGELSKFAGITFEEFVRKFLTDRMRRSGEIPEGEELRAAVIDGEEVDLFLESPLIVGEVTAHAESEEELNKLIRKAEKAREIYGREPRKILIVETAGKDVARRIREMAEEKGVEVIIGKEL